MRMNIDTMLRTTLNDEDDGAGTEKNTGKAGAHPFKELVLNKKQDAGYHIVRDSKGSKYVCKECGKKFINWGNFQKHMKDVHDKAVGEGKQIKCSICEEKVSTVVDLQKHVMIHETESEHYCCALCGEKFLRQFQLSHHRCHLLNSKLLPIEKGSKKRTWQISEVNHTHCPICNKLYSAKSSWQNHMSIHLGQQKFKCPVCCKAFSGRRELRIHMTLHTGERPFKCSWCPKRCTSKSNMAIHEKTHAAVYYLCCLCGKEFAKKSCVQAHECEANQNWRSDDDTKFLCNVCGENCGSMSAVKEHLSAHKDTHPYVCPRCGEGFKLKQDLWKHHKKERPLYQCTVCLKGFSTQDKLKAHELHKIDLQHKALQMEAPTLKNDAMEKAAKSKTSEKVLLKKDRQNDDAESTKKPKDSPSQSSIGIHVDTHEDPNRESELNKMQDAVGYHTGTDSKGSKYVCKECGKKFINWGNFQKHMKGVHDKAVGEGKQIKCSICEEKVSTVVDLQKHVMIHKTESEHYCCALCGEKFLRQFQLSHHRCHLLNSKLLPIEKGSKKRTWQISEVNHTHCPICNKLYSAKSSWQNHMSIHLGQQKFKCPVCCKAFSGRRELRIHMTLHTGERPFKCSWCPKRCTSKSNMAIHEKTHAAVYYLCCLCGKEFAKKSCMQAHECEANQNWRSDDDTKFLCNVCGENCGSMSAVKEHLSAHKDTHPYVCPRCGEGFKLKQDLWKHHKKERPLYQCTVCLKGFSTQDKLKAHELHKIDLQHKALQMEAPTLKNDAMEKAAKSKTSEKVLLKKDCQNDDAESTKKPKDSPSQSPIGIHVDTHEDPNRESELNKMQDAVGYHTDSKGSKYVCKECGKKFINWGNFQKHMKGVHDKAVREGKQIKCSICEEKVSTVADLQKHVMIHKTESEHYCCALCGEKFLRQFQLSHHRCHLLNGKLLPIEKGSKKRTWQISEVNSTHCPICNKLYSAKRSWQNHMSIHLGQQKFKCPVCCKAFSGRRELRIHMTLHTGERPFKCSWCPKRCASKSNMAIHENTHAAVYYLCCLCGKEFAKKSCMPAHKCGAELNGGPDSDRRFFCNVCGENCALVSILKQHVVFHVDTHPHVCPRCGQGFKLEQDLRKHTKIRRLPPECLDDYPYQCTVCFKRFGTQVKLKTHERNERYLKRKSQQKKKSSRQNDVMDKAATTPHSDGGDTDNIDMHTVLQMEDCANDQRLDDNSVTSQSSLYMYGLQEYPCFLCDKKLPTENKLKSHLKIHTGVKPHGCSKCGKRFDFRSALKKHKRSHKKKR